MSRTAADPRASRGRSVARVAAADAASKGAASRGPASRGPAPGRVAASRTASYGLFLAAVAVAFGLALVELDVPAGRREHLDFVPAWPDLLTGLALALAGLVVLRSRSHPVGWLMSGFGLWWLVDTAAATWLVRGTLGPTSWPGVSAAFWIYQRLGAGLLLALPLLLLLYPDGRLPAGRWRLPTLVSLVSTALLPLVLLLVPSDVAQLVTGSGPLAPELRSLNLDPFRLGLPVDVWTGLLRTAFLLVPVSLLVPFAVVVTRYRTSRGRRRIRMRWLLWAAVMDLVLMLSLTVSRGDLASYGLTFCVGVTAGSVAVGLTRPYLVDVDRLLGGTVVYGALVVASVLVDLAVLGVAGRLLGAGLSGAQAMLVAALVVTLVYAPLRHRLWRLVQRRTHGDRHDPYRVVSRLAERLEHSDAPDQQLLEVARAVGRAFRSPYVGVEVEQADGGRLLAEHGSRPAEVETMPIAYRGEEIGRLLLPRGPRPALRSADTRLLADVVRQAAAATRTTQLADELQASRERIVTAVEDERRRLRNELHDGLGPTLAAVASRIDVARMVGRTDPEESERTLGLAREEISGLLAEVRRLVYGLRPPALDDVGLVGALEQQVDRLLGPDLDVRVEVPYPLADLPAAVEVAVFRIVSEALANAVRHAGATRCAITLTREDARLVVDVVDDGAGISPEVAAGVGLVSMRERAAELRGRCRVTPGPGGGTWVRAELPLPAPSVTGTERGGQHVG